MDEKRFFEELYQKYKKLMFSQAYHYISNKSDAEDIVQEALEKLLKKYNVLNTLNDKALAAYVIFTVRSIAINHMKRENKQRLWGDYDDITVPSPSAEDTVLASLQPEDIFHVWKQLSQGEQTLLVQKYYLDFTMEELAKLYSCSVASIRVRLYRAREKMKKLVAENGKEEQ